MKGRELITYYFIGRLSPTEFCMKFNPREIHLGNKWVLDIFMDGISVWISGTTKEFAVIRPLVAEAFDIIVTTFMLITGSRLKYNIQNWVEARGVVSKSNMIGWFMPPGYKLITPNPKNRLNSAWRRAGRSYLKIKDSFNHRLALRDYKNCIETYGDDAFFYAYRIVEDIRRAVTEYLPEGSKREVYWKEMHKVLGTNKHIIEPLTNVAEKIRHGDINHSVVINARKNKDKIINIAFEIMKKEFRRKFKRLL